MHQQIVIKKDTIENSLLKPHKTLTSPFSPHRFSNLQFSIFDPNYIRLIVEITRYCHPNETYNRFKMFYRNLFWSSHSGNWFQQLANSPLLSKLVQQEKGLAEKLHRHILRRDNSIAKRALLLSEHYAVLEQIIYPKLLYQILLNGGLLLSHIEITSEQHFELVLRYAKFPGKEGELSFCWHMTGNNSPLASLSFTIIPSINDLSLYIGGLQGPSGVNSRDIVAEASKAFSGLSPKRVVMEALFAFAKHVGASTILAVSDDQQISQTKTSKHFKYDDYWLSLGAQRNAENDYLLPRQLIRKQILETPTKRRVKYRRQHAYLDAIYQNTLNALDS